MLQISPIKALADNYIWVIHNNQYAVILDPGEAASVIEFLENNRLTLLGILITHHHWDHTQGIAGLLKHYNVPVYGSAYEKIPSCTFPLKEESSVNIKELSLQLKVIAVPGHTKGHIAYYGHQWLFPGDTMFAYSCGRLFEGSAEEMFTSLVKLASLPDETKVYCAHEYTLDNLHFVQMIDPENSELKRQLKKVEQLQVERKPTLPTTIALEKAINPFLRAKESVIIKAAEEHAHQKLVSPVDVFRVLREWKDSL